MKRCILLALMLSACSHATQRESFINGCMAQGQQVLACANVAERLYPDDPLPKGQTK